HYPASPQTSTLSLHDALPIFGPFQPQRLTAPATGREHETEERAQEWVRGLRVDRRLERRKLPELEAHLAARLRAQVDAGGRIARSEEHTSELQSLAYLVCRLL